MKHLWPTITQSGHDCAAQRSNTGERRRKVHMYTFKQAREIIAQRNGTVFKLITAQGPSNF